MTVLIALTEIIGPILLYLPDCFKTISIISALDLLIFSLFNIWPVIETLFVSVSWLLENRMALCHSSGRQPHLGDTFGTAGDRIAGRGREGPFLL